MTFKGARAYSDLSYIFSGGGDKTPNFQDLRPLFQYVIPLSLWRCERSRSSATVHSDYATMMMIDDDDTGKITAIYLSVLRIWALITSVS